MKFIGDCVSRKTIDKCCHLAGQDRNLTTIRPSAYRRLATWGEAFGYEDHLRKALTFLVGVLIFFNPFPKLTAVEEIAFYSSFALFLMLAAKKQMRPSLNNPFALPLAMFLTWAVVGLFTALDVRNSSHDVYAHLFKYLVIFYLLVNVFTTELHLRILSAIIIASTSIYAAVTMFDFYLLLGNPLAMKLGYRMPWEIPTNVIGVLTVYSALLCLFSLLENNPPAGKIIFAAALLLLTFATLATQTRSAFAALITGLIVATPRLKKGILLLTPLILLMVLFMPVKNRLSPQSLIDKISSDDRINTWHTYYQILRDHPVTGIGFGFETYRDDALLAKYNARVPERYRLPVADKAPHNFLVDTAVRTGYVGLTLFMFIIIQILFTAGKLAFRGSNFFIRNRGLAMLAAIASWIIQSLFENTLSGPPAVVLILIMAMTVILWRLDRNIRTESTGKPA